MTMTKFKIVSKNGFRTAATTATITAMLTLAACGTSSGTPDGKGSEANPSAEPGGTKTITLSVITSNRYLETAKTNFETAHPGVKIEIKETLAAPKTDGNKQMVMMGPKDTKSAEKYLSTVSTELMSGKASDLFILDELPYKKYADKKLLENVNDLIKNDATFDRNQYFTNILDAMKYKDGMYAIPIKVSFNLLVGNQDLLSGAAIDDSKWTWKDFKAVADKLVKDDNKDGVPDHSALANMTEATFIGLLLDSSYTQFVDAGAKKANFTGKPFLDMLQMAKTMFDTKQIAPNSTDRSVNMFQSFTPIQYEDILLLPQMMFNGNSTAYYNMPTENDKKGLSFKSDLMLAMNSKSKNKKEAWEFVKYLLSEEMQASRDLMGFAVNKNANKIRMEQIASNTGKSNMKLMGKDGKEIVQKPADPKDVARIEALLTGVQSFGETDPKVRTIVQEETSAFFSGQKSAEETAKVIQSKVSTYLQE